MGFMDFIKELAGEQPDKGNPMVDLNDRSAYANHAGSLYLCVNKDSLRVTSVRLCDTLSPLKEDTFEWFIRQQVKQVKQLDFIPNERVFYYHIPDLANAPRVYKEDNDHFIPYLQHMEPRQFIDLTDAAFAVKYGFDLISKGRCFSGRDPKVGESRRYKEFMVANDKEKYRAVMDYYMKEIVEDYRKNRSIPYRNPVYDLLHGLEDQPECVEVVVRQIEKNKEVSKLMLDMLYPVLYNTEWGKKHISDNDMLNYVAKYNMKFLSVEFKNKRMLQFFEDHDLIFKVKDWDEAIEHMDNYVLHRGPGLTDEVKAIPGLTVSETLYRNILDKSEAIGKACYLRLCEDLRTELTINPDLDTSLMYPDFFRKDCPGARPMPQGADEHYFEYARIQEELEKEESERNRFKFHF